MKFTSQLERVSSQPKDLENRRKRHNRYQKTDGFQVIVRVAAPWQQTPAGVRMGWDKGVSMSADVFEKTIRALVGRDPFEPFVFEFVDGRTILVENREKLAFNGGGAGYLANEQIHLIDCEYVRDIRPALQAA